MPGLHNTNTGFNNPNMGILTVIHTSDFHNHINLSHAGQLRNLRLEREALLLDSGDAIWAGNIFVKPGPEQAIRRMNEAGYDAMTMGNREYFFRSLGMLMKTAEASFPVLNANLLPHRGNLGHIRRWTILQTVQGNRVGVFGLSRLMIPPGSWMELFSDMRFLPHARAAKEALAALRNQCDWIICLSHIGLDDDIKIAQEFNEIDLILGGHSHFELPEPVIENGVTISHIGAYAKSCEILTSDLAQCDAGFSREVITFK